MKKHAEHVVREARIALPTSLGSAAASVDPSRADRADGYDHATGPVLCRNFGPAPGGLGIRTTHTATTAQAGNL